MSITKISSLNQINFHKYTDKDIVAFDLDDTLFVRKDKILRNANVTEMNKFIDTIRQVSKERVTYLYDHAEYMLVEEVVTSYISALNEKNTETVSITARRTGKPSADCKTNVEDDTISVLNKLGIKFKSNVFVDCELKDMSYTNPNLQNQIVEPTLRPFDFPSNAMMKNNVIFTNNLNKGLIIGKLFEYTKKIPDIFVFIDDKEKNHISMIEDIKKINELYSCNIVYEGYLYSGATDLLDNNLDENVVNLQKTYLLKNDYSYVSDTDAHEMIYGKK